MSEAQKLDAIAKNREADVPDVSGISRVSFFILIFIIIIIVTVYLFFVPFHFCYLVLFQNLDAFTGKF